MFFLSAASKQDSGAECCQVLQEPGLLSVMRPLSQYQHRTVVTRKLFTLWQVFWYQYRNKSLIVKNGYVSEQQRFFQHQACGGRNKPRD